MHETEEALGCCFFPPVSDVKRDCVMKRNKRGMMSLGLCDGDRMLLGPLLGAKTDSSESFV